MTEPLYGSSRRVMPKFATGKHALGVCDRCGLQFKLNRLKALIIKGKRTNMLVCHACFDPDHPQLKLGEKPVQDPQALRNPRPDTGLEASRQLTGSWEDALARLTIGSPG